MEEIITTIRRDSKLLGLYLSKNIEDDMVLGAFQRVYMGYIYGFAVLMVPDIPKLELPYTADTFNCIYESLTESGLWNITLRLMHLSLMQQDIFSTQAGAKVKNGDDSTTANYNTLMTRLGRPIYNEYKTLFNDYNLANGVVNPHDHTYITPRCIVGFSDVCGLMFQLYTD